MTIPFQFPQISQGPVIANLPQVQRPDLSAAFLQAMLGSQQEAGANSRSSAQLDVQKQELALRVAEQKTQQEALKHQQEITRQQGEATQLFLQTIMPHLAATGQLPQMTPQQPAPVPFNPKGPAGQPLPAIQQTQTDAPAPAPTDDTRLQNFLTTMDPQAANQFVKEQLPHLLELRRGTMEAGKGQAIQAGDQVTTFVPGKGFWDATANGGKGGYVPSITRHLSADEMANKALDRQLRLESIASQQAYRASIQAQTLTNSFDRRTKDLRDRGRIIMQAQQTIGDAANNPDPAQRRVLYSSAIANFVQAADQKAQLRYQLLDYFKKNVDPSIGGKWEVLKGRLLQGELPKYVSTGMLTHLQNLLNMTTSEYNKHRDGEIKRHPDLQNWLPEPDEFFTSDHSGNGAAVAPPQLDQIFGGIQQP